MRPNIFGNITRGSYILKMKYYFKDYILVRALANHKLEDYLEQRYLLSDSSLDLRWDFFWKAIDKDIAYGSFVNIVVDEGSTFTSVLQDVINSHLVRPDRKLDFMIAVGEVITPELIKHFYTLLDWWSNSRPTTYINSMEEYYNLERRQKEEEFKYNDQLDEKCTLECKQFKDRCQKMPGKRVAKKRDSTSTPLIESNTTQTAMRKEESQRRSNEYVSYFLYTTLVVGSLGLGIAAGSVILGVILLGAMVLIAVGVWYKCDVSETK